MNELKSFLEYSGFIGLAISLCFGPALLVSFIPLAFNWQPPYLYNIITIPILPSGPFIMIFTMKRLFPDEDEMEEAFRSQL